MTEAAHAVVIECDLPQPPEKVWQALIVPELLTQWLPDAVDCEILAAEPPRKLCYRWRPGELDRDEGGRVLDSVVTFELSATPEGGTHLRVDHRIVAVAPVVSIGRALVGRKAPVACAAGAIYGGPMALAGGSMMLAMRRAA